MEVKSIVFIVLWIPCALSSTGTAILTLPASANCGDQAVLTCTSTGCNNSYTFTRSTVTIYNTLGLATGINSHKYTATVISDNRVNLYITNIELSDAQSYSCACSFNKMQDEKTLQYHCKANASTTAITPEKKLSITVDILYPHPSSIATALTTPTTQLPGTFTCLPSPTFASHFKCTWISTASVPDGHHSYTIAVTTAGQEALVSGYFTIVTPTSPAISNLTTINNKHQVLRGVQDTSLTIQCLSKGGIPAPTLAWYRGSTSTYPLEQSHSDSVQQSDGTYTITLTYMFTPKRTDDMTQFLCQVFYPGATPGASPNPSPASALLYLDLKPDIVSLSQTGETVSGGNMTLQCTSANGRPIPSITWSYKGQTFKPTNILSINTTSETYTVMSVLHRLVSADDNGQRATCIVSHTTLPDPVNGTVKIDVKFGPSKGSTTIYGNEVTSATGANQIRLNCTSGSSNPASNITWYNGSDINSNVEGYRSWSGKNSGIVTSNILTIVPTRYMDEDRITCKVDNIYSSDSKFVDLDIRYSPLIQQLSNKTSTEGEPELRLKCLASSKPFANFRWYKGNTVLTSGVGTPTDNSFSYVIPRVDRTDAGSYRCQAENNVEPSDSKNMYLTVKYPPAVTISTTLSPSYIVTCAAEGYPDSYTYQDWVQIWPGYGPVATIPFTGTTLNLTGATYERSGVYVCGASNGVVVYGTNVSFVNGNATILIKAPPVLTDPRHVDTRAPVAGKLGQYATTAIKYWSNVDGSVVKCYKLVGGSRSSSSSCSVTYTDTNVTLPVHNQMVKEIGTLAIIKIHILSQEDMASYDVVVSNSEPGQSVLGITIFPQGPPEAPTLTGNFSITPGLVILSVVPGYNGGYNQTLVVQISTDLTTWINKTSVNIGLESRTTDVILSGFRENTIHHVRVFAYNTEGRSNNFSTVMNFTTAKDPPTASTLAAKVGGAVGTICALLVIAVALLVLWRNRKAEWKISPRADTRSLAKDQDNTESVVECAMYVSAGNVQPGTSKGAEYSTPVKRGRSDPSANTYAVVSKKKDNEKVAASTTEDPKRGKKRGKYGKPTKEIPQVAETTFDTTNNATCNPPLRPMKYVNDDGLIYVDLEFDSTAKYDVIHGLDDVTIYVEIDFTKTAEPLADSDEESIEKK